MQLLPTVYVTLFTVLLPVAPLPAITAGSNVVAATGLSLNQDGVFIYDTKGMLVAATGGKLPE